MDLRSDQLSPDHLDIDTPELVSIEMPLAGIGSRFIALLVDYLIWFAGLLVLLLLFAVFLPGIRAYSRLSAQWADRHRHFHRLSGQLGLLHPL